MGVVVGSIGVAIVMVWMFGVGAMGNVVLYGKDVSLSVEDMEASFGRTIGDGHEEGDMYRLVQSPVAATCQRITVGSALQCHRRLRHPSLDKLHCVIPHLSPTMKIQCDACQLGKHHRASFPASILSTSSACFDLLHCDIWGPNRVADCQNLNII